MAVATDSLSLRWQLVTFRSWLCHRQRDFTIWSASLVQLVAQVGQQSAGAQGSLRELYGLLKLSMFDSSGLVHPECLSDDTTGVGAVFRAELLQFAVVLTLSLLFITALISHAIVCRSKHGVSVAITAPIHTKVTVCHPLVW
jgi:hypothetical protein